MNLKFYKSESEPTSVEEGALWFDKSTGSIKIKSGDNWETYGGGSNDVVEIEIVYNSDAKTCYLVDNSIMNSLLDLYNAGTQLVVTAPTELMGGSYILNKVPVLRVTDSFWSSLNVNKQWDAVEEMSLSTTLYLVLNKIDTRNCFIVLCINKNIGNVFALQESEDEILMGRKPVFRLFDGLDWYKIDQMASGWSSLSPLVKTYETITAEAYTTTTVNVQSGYVYTCTEPLGDIKFNKLGLAVNDDDAQKEIIIKLHIADYVPTVSWPSAWIWPHRTPPVLEANTYYEINIAYVSNKWCGTYQSFRE